MASINTAVVVNVNRQLTPITTAGFNLQMFLGKHKGFTERMKTYASISEVATDFSTDSNEYKAASAAFGQTPAVTQFAIGRQDTTTVTYTPTVANSTSYTVTINGTLFSFVSDASATAAEIVTGLTTAINADAVLPVTASGSTTLILTADVGGVPFSAKASVNLVPAYATTETLTQALDAVRLYSDAFYGVTAYSHVKADQLEVAAWALANKKLYKTSSSDTNIINQSLAADTTSIAKALKDAANAYAGVIYSAVADSQFPECGYFGVMFGYEAGEATMEFKTIAGVTVDNLTGTQITNATDKYATVFIPRGGVNTIHKPYVSSGLFDDSIRDVDYAANDLQVSIYGVQVNNSKLPFTAAGFATVEGAIRASMQRSTSQGIFADDRAFTLLMPKVSDISANDKAQRKLTGIKVNAYLAGAIHFVEISLNCTL